MCSHAHPLLTRADCPTAQTLSVGSPEFCILCGYSGYGDALGLHALQRSAVLAAIASPTQKPRAPALRCMPHPSSYWRCPTPSRPKTIYVGNLPFQSVWQEVHDVFAAVGAVENVQIPVGRDGRFVCSLVLIPTCPQYPKPSLTSTSVPVALRSSSTSPRLEPSAVRGRVPLCLA
jgi:hypothetical protein